MEKPTSTKAFEELCEIKLNPKTDMYHFYYAGQEQFKSKSLFECKIQQKMLQKEFKA